MKTRRFDVHNKTKDFLCPYNKIQRSMENKRGASGLCGMQGTINLHAYTYRIDGCFYQALLCLITTYQNLEIAKKRYITYPHSKLFLILHEVINQSYWVQEQLWTCSAMEDKVTRNNNQNLIVSIKAYCFTNKNNPYQK